MNDLASIEIVDGPAELAALRAENVVLRQELAFALEMLRVMQEELQHAHDELAAR